VRTLLVWQFDRGPLAGDLGGHVRPDVLALAARVKYVIDPNNPYPKAFTGHIRATLNDGRVTEQRQPHFRGGADEPLTHEDIVAKFRLNVRHGGWRPEQGDAALEVLGKLYGGAIHLNGLRA
jgi:2-methylcitrate dehydratase PrpD